MSLKIEFLLMHDGCFFGNRVSFVDSCSSLNPSKKDFKTSKKEIWKKFESSAGSEDSSKSNQQLKTH